MHPLSDHDIVRIWEEGLYQHDIDRALTVLSAAFPGQSRSDFAKLTIGERDSKLLILREMTFGNRLICFAVCPQCRERLQFSFTTDALRLEQAEGATQNRELAVEGLIVRIRLPDSRDLAAVANCPERENAFRVLLQRCMVGAYRNGAPVQYQDLDEAVISAMAERIAELDPQAEVLLDLNCSACGHRWSALFDIVPFFWKEIAVHAQRLLEEVVVLSKAYGWREADIFEMGPVRRQFYLGRVN